MARPDNRTALLRGARECLEQQGYARTRARDVATAAGVSTAAIGYHFGSIDRLLVTALVEGVEEWSRAAGLGASSPDGPRPLAEVCAGWVATFEDHRGVLAASFELVAQSADRPEVRAQVAEALESARRGLVAQVAGADSPAAGHALYALLSGLLVQHLVDPDGVPSGPDVVAALRGVVT